MQKQGNAGQARYCLSKAITADPADISLRFHRASLYVELRDYHKAAESYEQIARLCPDNVEALKTAAMIQPHASNANQSICKQAMAMKKERCASILEEYLINHPSKADLSIFDLLASICMDNKAHTKALQHIEHAQYACCDGKELPLYLAIKAGICHIHIGNTEKAETIFSLLKRENVHDHRHLVSEVADSLMALEQYNAALNYYMMLEGSGEDKNLGFLVWYDPSMSGRTKQVVPGLLRKLPRLEDDAKKR
ncbi:hypothetical protein U1Q18_010868 [Sarracenia purpurea var. burkii]